MMSSILIPDFEDRCLHALIDTQYKVIGLGEVVSHNNHMEVRRCGLGSNNNHLEFSVANCSVSLDYWHIRY